MTNGFRVLVHTLQWLVHSFYALPDDQMDGNGSFQYYRLAIKITSCCRGFPKVVEKMRIHLIEGWIRYAEFVVDVTLRGLQNPRVNWLLIRPLELTPCKYFTEEMWRRLRRLAQRQVRYENHYALYGIRHYQE